MAVIKKILDSERTFPHQICPKCPVIFGSESPNSFEVKLLGLVWFKTLDIEEESAFSSIRI